MGMHGTCVEAAGCWLRMELAAMAYGVYVLLVLAMAGHGREWRRARRLVEQLPQGPHS